MSNQKYTDADYEALEKLYHMNRYWIDMAKEAIKDYVEFIEACRAEIIKLGVENSLLVAVLNEINREEINYQLSDGTRTKSEILSYDVLKKIGKLK